MVWIGVLVVFARKSRKLKVQCDAFGVCVVVVFVTGFVARDVIRFRYVFVFCLKYMLFVFVLVGCKVCIGRVAVDGEDWRLDGRIREWCCAIACEFIECGGEARECAGEEDWRFQQVRAKWRRQLDVEEFVVDSVPFGAVEGDGGAVCECDIDDARREVDGAGTVDVCRAVVGYATGHEM